MSDAANVIAGSGSLYIAPKGTAIPLLTSLPVDWSNFTQFGYTDDGVEFANAPTYKDITVDEEMSPVQKLLTAEKLTASVKLAESTLINLHYAISGSSLTLNSPVGTSVLKWGSPATIPEFVLGFQGPAPGANATRVIILRRVISVGNSTFKYQRTDKVVYAVQFEALADSAQPAGQRLALAVDFNAAGS